MRGRDEAQRVQRRLADERAAVPEQRDDPVTMRLDPAMSSHPKGAGEDPVRCSSVLQQLQGFKRELILADRNTDKVFAVPLWETEADMIASETSGWLQESFANYVGVFAGPPVTEHYEVSMVF